MEDIPEEKNSAKEEDQDEEKEDEEEEEEDDEEEKKTKRQKSNTKKSDEVSQKNSQISKGKSSGKIVLDAASKNSNLPVYNEIMKDNSEKNPPSLHYSNKYKKEEISSKNSKI